MIKNIPTFLLLTCLALSARVGAVFGFNLDGTMDKPIITRANFERDFARTLLPLEANK
jgi:hypothetical protein